MEVEHNIFAAWATYEAKLARIVITFYENNISVNWTDNSQQCAHGNAQDSDIRPIFVRLDVFTQR